MQEKNTLTGVYVSTLRSGLYSVGNSVLKYDEIIFESEYVENKTLILHNSKVRKISNESL